MAHIKRQHAIGVGADGVVLFKNGRLCWLQVTFIIFLHFPSVSHQQLTVLPKFFYYFDFIQIATKDKIYLFDILLLGARAFKNGLSQILENKHILKVCDET